MMSQALEIRRKGTNFREKQWSGPRTTLGQNDGGLRPAKGSDQQRSRGKQCWAQSPRPGHGLIQCADQVLRGHRHEWNTRFRMQPGARPGDHYPVPSPPLTLPDAFTFIKKKKKRRGGKYRGAWVAQSVKHLTSAQVMISRPVGSSPASGPVLTAWTLELLRVLCLPLSLPLPCSCFLPLSLSKINKH